MKIDRNSRNQVWAIVAYVRKGVVLPSRHREWCSTLDMHQRRKFPIIDKQRCKAVGDMEVALGDNDDIFDVPEIGSTRPVIQRRIIWVFYVCTSIIPLRVREAKALRPGVVGQKAEVGRKTMLDRGDQAIVISHSVVIDKDRATAAACVLIALNRVRNGEGKTLSLIGDSGTRRSGCACRLARGTCCHDSGATSTSRTPDSGDVESWADWSTHGGMDRVATHVVNLELPALTKLTLHAGCPLLGV